MLKPISLYARRKPVLGGTGYDAIYLGFLRIWACWMLSIFLYFAFDFEILP